MVTDEQRAAEHNKYELVYNNPNLNYAMGHVRMQDAIKDLKWAQTYACRNYLDIGCGRGEMLKHADALGFLSANGTDIVDDLVGDRVQKLFVHELRRLDAEQFDLVSSFDVIEHLHPGDDIALLEQMSRIANTCMVVTANNKRSVDPTTGNDLHINKKPYEEWDKIINKVWKGWTVEWVKDKQYVSETWRAYK